LAEGDAEPGKLENTMLRYARAMQIAANPSEERREYAKKLYKLIAPEGDSQLALFSQFAAGEIDKEQLKKQWAEKTLGKEKQMNQRWKLYDKTTGEPVAGFEFNNYTEDDAWKMAAQKLGMSVSNVQGGYELRNMSEEQQWEIYNVDTGETLEIVRANNKGAAADAVYDKYAAQKIGFNVRAYQDPATMTPRAKLAKRIAEPKAEPKQTVDMTPGNWEFFYEPTGRVLDAVTGINTTQARAVLADVQRRYDDLAAPSIKMRKTGEATPDVAQNFEPDYSAFERNSDRIDAIRARQDATEVPRNWEFVDRINGQVIHNMTNASYNQANAVQTNLELRYPDADIYLRSVERPN
jgi:hypothetical protein